MSEQEKCRIEEKKMIGFLADKLWDVMTIPCIYDQFTDADRETVNAIRNHFADHPEYVLFTKQDEGWNKTL